jgi:hypothetical protein
MFLPVFHVAGEYGLLIRLVLTVLVAVASLGIIPLNTSSASSGRVYVHIYFFESHMSVSPKGTKVNITTNDGIHYYFTGDIYGDI